MNTRICIYFIVCIFLWYIGYLISNSIQNEYVNLINDLARLAKASQENRLHENFFKILITNLFVGVILSFGGYFTGGIITVLVSIWNGFLMGVTLNIFFLKIGYSNLELFLRLFSHVPFEVISFCWFGAYGISGGQVLFSIMKQGDIIFVPPKPIQLIYPSILLTISAFFESALIYINKLQ